MILNNFKSLFNGRNSKNLAGTYSGLSDSNLITALHRQYNNKMSEHSWTSNTSNMGSFSQLVIGTNDAEVTLDDYIIHIVDETYITYISQAIEVFDIQSNPTLDYTYRITRTISYSSEATENLIVNEIGLYERYIHSNDNGGYKSIQIGDGTGDGNSGLNLSHLLIREKLETPVVLKPGDIYTFVLTIK